MVLAALFLLAPLSACEPLTDTAEQPDGAPAADGTALALLEELDEKGRAPKTGYDRDSFGWRDDMDRNGCDTRNDILRRDLEDITLKPGTDGCVVLTGTLLSPFSGESVAFDRTASAVDIDHVVALSDAWQTGAATWDDSTKREFANDPLNLLAVEASLNRQKGDGDAATWLPPKRESRCEYVARQIAVKHRYELWVKPAEADAMRRVLADCADQPAPDADEPSAEEPASGAGGKTAPFENCDAARAAGAAPVRADDPGYGKHLDRDGDGVGCA